MMDSRHNIFVYADWKGLGGPVQIGILHSQLLRGKEIFSFEYDESWLANPQSQTLDPELQLFSGVQYLNDPDKSNFGLCLDSSPDRWGRVLMLRREAAMARGEQRPAKKLFETDFLLGVFDGHRMGGLRFKTEPDGPFLNDDVEMASPPWTSLRQLEEISLRLEEDDAIDQPQYLQWLNMLVAPGTSLGGARPKASILDPNNQLWIAKFPSKLDGSDTGAWEMVVYELATKAGVEMAVSTSQKFSGRHHTFLTKRFDRTSSGERIHFASAMTLLGYRDGYDFIEGASYLELAEFLIQRGGKVSDDLAQLWRRIVFNICISNTDDHLRNHGFLLTKEGWIISPAFDLNPVENSYGLKLNISENDNSLELGLAMEVHPFFRLTKSQAKEIISEIQTVVQTWRTVATKFGIPRAEQELKGSAFAKASEAY